MGDGITSKMRRRVHTAFEADPNSGCWLWTGAINAHGYGVMNSRGYTVYAHRLAYTEAHGPIASGLVIRHLCDTRCCVNPLHLQPGTHAENMRDKAKRALPWHGTRYRRFSDEQRRQLSAMADLPTKECARIMGVSPDTIRNARRKGLS